MGTNNDINIASCEFVERNSLLLCCFKARDDIYIDRTISKAVTKVFIVLLSEQGSRHQNSDLLSRLHSNKGSAHRHFCFAKAHITTNKPVHWLCGFHIANNRFNRHTLIRGFLKGESGGKALIFKFWRCKRKAFASCASSVNAE